MDEKFWPTIMVIIIEDFVELVKSNGKPQQKVTSNGKPQQKVRRASEQLFDLVNIYQHLFNTSTALFYHDLSENFNIIHFFGGLKNNIKTISPESMPSPQIKDIANHLLTIPNFEETVNDLHLKILKSILIEFDALIRFQGNEQLIQEKLHINVLHTSRQLYIMANSLRNKFQDKYFQNNLNFDRPSHIVIFFCRFRTLILKISKTPDYIIKNTLENFKVVKNFQNKVNDMYSKVICNKFK